MVDEISLGDIIPFESRVCYDGRVVEDLGGSILQNGIVNPLLVRPKDGKYELVDGEYRRKALEHIKWEKPVPVVKREMSDEQAELERAVSNWHRKNFSFHDKAHRILQLSARFSSSEMASKLELSPEIVRKYLTYVHNVPKETRQMVFTSEQFTFRHAEALVMLKGYPDRQLELAERIVTENLSGPQALREADKILHPEKYGPRLYECDFCDGKFKSEETKNIRLCATCLAEFATYINLKRVKIEAIET